MRGFSRRHMIAGVAAVAGAGVLAACRSERPRSAAPEGTGGVTATNIKGQRLVFLHWWTNNLGPGYDEFMQWAADTFRGRTGAEVEYQTGPAGGGLNQKLITMIAGGQPPDSTFVSVVFGRDNYDAGILRNLRAYIAKAPDVSETEWFESSRLFRTKGSDVFGIPVMGPESLCFAISKAHMEAAALDPRGSGIRSWADLATTAQKLTKVEGGQFAQIGMLVPGLSLPWLATWIYANGGQLMAQDESKYLLNAPAAIEAAQSWIDLIYRYRVCPPLNAERPANARQAFVGGQVSIIWDSTSTGLVNAPPGFEWWLVPVPPGPRGRGPASATWTNMVSIPTDARNPDAAFEWMRFFTSVEVGVERFKRLQGQHPRVKFYQTPEWQQAVKEKPFLAAIPEIAALPGPYPYVRYNRLSSELAQVFREISLANVGVSEGLNQAQQIADRVMAEPLRVQ